MLRSSASLSVESSTAPGRAAVIRTFTVVAALAFILRIWYAGHLYQDDGLWFTAAEEILRGKTLYRDIFFDKPPALPLLYAGLFRIFGAHLITIRLFTICYSIAISALLYLFGSRLYDRRTGRLAALMFSVFSTTYISGDMQSLNTELLMAPFYAAGAFLMIRSAMRRSRWALLAFGGGAMTGLAFHTNPKGALNLALFVLLLLASLVWDGGSAVKRIGAALNAFGLVGAGFVSASIPFLLYISATHSLSRYKLYVWDWGFRYAGYYPASRSAEIFLGYGTDYFLINNLLFISLAVVSGVTVAGVLRYARGSRSTARSAAPDWHSTEHFRSDGALLIWFAVSFAGVALGGRFFAHYYFQVLPSLCLIGARGLEVIGTWAKGRSRYVRAIASAVLISGFVYTLVRAHSETVGLAIDWMRGTRSEINREGRVMAATVRDLADPVDAVDRGAAEAIREGGPRTRPPHEPADYLFVWGNWPEVYYWSGLIPASGYLSSQPLTGLPADVWYGSGDYSLILDDRTTAAARAELVRDLKQTTPKYIIDELGFRDARFSIERYPDLSELMRDYEKHNVGSGVPIFVRRSHRE